MSEVKKEEEMRSVMVLGAVSRLATDGEINRRHFSHQKPCLFFFPRPARFLLPPPSRIITLPPSRKVWN